MKRLVLLGALSLVLTFATATWMQMSWWISKYGWRWSGTCVNHMGEAYPCHAFHWLSRMLSPFALPVILLIFVGWLVIIDIAWWCFRKWKPSKDPQPAT